jgi:hypothetical protein
MAKNKKTLIKVIPASEMIYFLEIQKALRLQEIKIIDAQLQKYKPSSNIKEPSWPIVVQQVMKAMPGLHTKAEITIATQKKLENWHLSLETVKNKVSNELLFNKNVVKTKVGKTYKYSLKNNRNSKPKSST